MKQNWIWGAAILLAILHQDLWYWNDATLLFGFMPIGLAYHMGYSISAAILWSFAVVYAWPTTVEDEVKEHLEAVGDLEGAKEAVGVLEGAEPI